MKITLALCFIIDGINVVNGEKMERWWLNLLIDDLWKDDGLIMRSWKNQN